MNRRQHAEMRIVISYRHADTAPYAGRVRDRLCHDFGEQNIFMDIDTIEPGEEFRSVIARAIARADVMIVLIGAGWLTAKDAHGRRRLDRSNDYVRTEILAALENGLRIIPVLVGGAVMPESDELPLDLSPLASLHGFDLSDGRFHSDMNKLIATITRGISRATPTDSAARPADPFPYASSGGRWKLFTITLTSMLASGAAFAILMLFWPWHIPDNRGQEPKTAAPPSAAATATPSVTSVVVPSSPPETASVPTRAPTPTYSPGPTSTPRNTARQFRLNDSLSVTFELEAGIKPARIEKRHANYLFKIEGSDGPRFRGVGENGSIIGSLVGDDLQFSFTPRGYRVYTRSCSGLLTRTANMYQGECTRKDNAWTFRATHIPRTPGAPVE